MRHPSDGTLRRLVDDPAGVADADREHVASCPECLTGLAAAQQDAALTDAALAVPMDVDVDGGWQRLAHATQGSAKTETTAGPGRRWQSRLRSPMVAGVGVLALLAGASAAAAGDWLEVFSTEQVAPVAITEQDLVQLPDLSDYGELDVTEEVSIREVDSAALAERATGLETPEVDDLPTGVTGEPTYRVVDAGSATFTFSAEQAREAAEDDETVPPPPAGLDGSQFRLEAGPGLAAVWSEERGLPALVVARAIAPTVYSSGVPFETARSYLLSMPGLPDDVATQLRSFAADGTTLPIPVPDDLMTSESTEVDGVDATLIEARDGTMAGVVWVQEGVVTAVAGSLTDDEVLAIARELG